jgi:hypothetical protein
MRRRLRNLGPDPVTRYLVRISVDRYPGEPAQRPLPAPPAHLGREATTRIQVSGMGAVQVVLMDVMPIRVRRTPRLIDRPGRLLVTRGQGTFVVEQGHRQVCLVPGEFGFHDTRRPYESARHCAYRRRTSQG